MNKICIIPGEEKAPYPGGESEKICNFVGGLYIKKSPGNKVENQPGETYEKICLYINIWKICIVKLSAIIKYPYNFVDWVESKSPAIRHKS